MRFLYERGGNMYSIYVFQDMIQKEIEQVFNHLYSGVTFHYLSSSILKIEVELAVFEEWIDCQMIHGSIVSDFGVDTTIVEINDIAFSFLTEDMIVQYLPSLERKAYQINSLLIALSRHLKPKQLLKRQLVDYIGQEYISTILTIGKMNMNFSMTAKALFLHRNSLNYRVDKIKQKTSIDVRTFQGLRAFISILE